jgi:hypothetical protein
MAMKKFGLYLQELLETPGDGTGGGGSGDAGAGGGDKAPAGGSGSGTGAGADGNTPGQGGGSGKQTANPWDAEKRGMLADLARERKSRQDYERRVTAIEAEREQDRRRIAALAGVNVPTKDDAAREAIKAEIGQMYPALGKLTPEQLDKVEALLGKADSLEAAVEHHWTNHANGMIDKAFAGVEKMIGGGKLSERQQSRLGQLYLSEAANNPDFLKRHNAGDPAVIDEFVKTFVEDFFEPARRSAIAEQTRRQRPVPDGKGRSVSVGGKPLVIKTDADFGNAMTAAFKEQGGQFGE